MDNRSPDHPPAPYLRILFWSLRVFFYLLYHPMAWTYDWVAAAVSLGQWKSWVLSALPYLQGPRILELGHGPGHLQKALWEKGQTGLFVVGLDASSQMGRLAHHNLESRGNRPKLVNGRAQYLPFEDGAFENVVATFPTEYIFDPSTMSEIRRVLVPGGRLVLLTSAVLVGKRRSEQTAAWLFKVTGQSTPWEQRLINPLRQIGFLVSLDEVRLPSSVLMMLLGEKIEGVV